VNNLKRLGSSHPSLIDGEAVQSLQNGLDLGFSQQFPCKLLCVQSNHQSYVTYVLVSDSLKRPCLIWFVAKESTESTSTIILIIISDIEGERGISV
jgi:hypothetical protein